MPAPLLVAFLALAAVTTAIVLVNVASFAYGRLSLDGWWTGAPAVRLHRGRLVRHPGSRFQGTTAVDPTLVRVFGTLYVVPRPVRLGTKVLAGNVGGALIPAGLSGRRT